VNVEHSQLQELSRVEGADEKLCNGTPKHDQCDRSCLYRGSVERLEKLDG
jgi:hypothetical protein